MKWMILILLQHLHGNYVLYIFFFLQKNYGDGEWLTLVVCCIRYSFWRMDRIERIFLSIFCAVKSLQSSNPIGMIPIKGRQKRPILTSAFKWVFYVGIVLTFRSASIPNRKKAKRGEEKQFISWQTWLFGQ